MKSDFLDSDIANEITNDKVKEFLKKIEENKGCIGLLVVSQSSFKLLWR
ncbi:MAG: hypothetical protein IJU40_06760 [Desulfovibrionaceae bacterium]|nr:hypothetical protein [Desulfovibrionaceae bacterium]